MEKSYMIKGKINSNQQSGEELQEKNLCKRRLQSQEGLCVEGLCKKYRRFQLRDVSLDIPPGSILGLLGRNGAGKTTTIKILSGHTSKSSGKIQIGGVDMNREPVQAKSNIGFMIDEHMFFEGRSLWENGIAFGKFYEKFSKAEWRKWLTVCRLKKTAYLNSLSKGERMKFQFAFAMAHHPKVLLLDEPTGNLDPIFRKEFLDILQEVVEEQQMSVLLSSHLTSDLEQVADRVALMEQGEILYTDSMEHMKSRFCLVKGSPEEGRRIKEGNYPEVVGIQAGRVGFEAMLDLEIYKDLKKIKMETGNPGEWIRDNNETYLQNIFPELLQEEIDLSKWMYYMTKGEYNHG